MDRRQDKQLRLPAGRLLLSVVAAVFLMNGITRAAETPNDAARAEWMTLEGTWILHSIERDPPQANRDEGRGLRCILKAGQLVAQLPGPDQPALGKLLVSVDTTKNPRAVDLRPAGEQEAVLGIYHLAGNTLRVCIASPDRRDRPREFAVQPGSGHSLFVLKRETPAPVAAAEPREKAAQDAGKPTRLCVVWTSGDPEVAKNVCFMYTGNAKKRGWFDEVHLVVWGPSAKLLAGNQELQAAVQAMQQAGVVTEACVTCARNYGVVEALQGLKIDVKPMGVPLSERLQADWKVITF